MFEPIAIIGRACLLPGALNPEQLWQNVLQQKDCLTTADKQLWRLEPESILINGHASPERLRTARMGCIQGFETLFDPNGFALSADYILNQDVLSQWLLHVGRAALRDAGYAATDLAALQTGAIMGNLSYPTSKLVQYAESIWLTAQGPQVIGDAVYKKIQAAQTSAENRFMSGYPVQLLAQALQLTAGAFAIDAACASSLYAIKLACDQLQTGKAHMMLAGGINATDSLFLQMGFSALQALSHSGRSRPLHRHADGLIPAQGVGVVLLKRLTDAVADKDKIHGVIRGIGLSNDGHARGFLVPGAAGQLRAMRQAYVMSNLTPTDISWVECHATGTALGDNTEINSMSQIFADQTTLSVGALKANIGHTITASGAAALINVLSAFAAKTKPPTREAAAEPLQILHNSALRLLTQPEPWDTVEGRRCAAINCFGFGGNNAHLLVQDWDPAEQREYHVVPANISTVQTIAIVGVGVLAASAVNSSEFAHALLQEQSLLSANLSGVTGGYMDAIELDMQTTRFPPNDLERTLGQQLAVLKASQEALQKVKNIATEKTAVLMGMQCDAEIARTGLRWRLATLLPHQDEVWLTQAREQIHPPLQAADVIGMMPNIVANRLNQQFDFSAPSFSLSAEELSGIVALQQGMFALQKREIEMAVVGAVDMCCEQVHLAAVNAMPQLQQKVPGDAAVVLVLKRLEDAQHAGDKIYALLPADAEMKAVEEWDTHTSAVTKLFGHAHAASGLLHVAAAALTCDATTMSAVKVTTHALNGQSVAVNIQKHNWEEPLC